MRSIVFSTERQSNYELLRIIAIICIIMHHYSLFGFFEPVKTVPLTSTINNVLLIAMLYGGKFGTDIFLIISGYFLISQDFRISKFLKLILQYMFYCITLLILSVKYNIINHYNYKMVVTAIFPLTGFSWFADAYLLLYLFHPFLNTMLKNLSKTQYKTFLVLGATIWFLIPTIGFTFNIDLNINYSNAVLFCYLYSLGAYIKLFDPRFKSNLPKRLALNSFLLYMVLSFLFLTYNQSDYFSVLSMNNSILVLVTALGVFLYFKNLSLKNNTWINTLSSCTFGIYLLHDNNLTRYYLWHTLLHVDSYYSESLFVIYSLSIVMIVFFSCAAIDFIRLTFLDRPFFCRYEDLINRYYEKIQAILITRI